VELNGSMIEHRLPSGISPDGRCCPIIDSIIVSI
jgi:hypothetical protein